jgi:hypothetical protein
MKIFNNTRINGCYIQKEWSNTIHQDRHENSPRGRNQLVDQERNGRTNFVAGTGVNIILVY